MSLFRQLKLFFVGFFLVVWSLMVWDEARPTEVNKLILIHSIILVGLFIVAYAFLVAFFDRNRPSEEQAKGETRSTCQNTAVKEMASEDSLLAEYAGAWKQIEYNMNTNWQFIGMLLSLAVAATFAGSFFQARKAVYNFFFLFSIGMFLVLGIVYFFFFKHNTAVAHLHSIRRLEIEAYLGMRTSWREYLDRKESAQNIDMWVCKKVEGFKPEDKKEAKKIIDSNDRCESPEGILNRIAHQKRQDALQKWELTSKWMSARYLVYAGGIILGVWLAVTFCLGLWVTIN